MDELDLVDCLDDRMDSGQLGPPAVHLVHSVHLSPPSPLSIRWSTMAKLLTRVFPNAARPGGTLPLLRCPMHHPSEALFDATANKVYNHYESRLGVLIEKEYEEILAENEGPLPAVVALLERLGKMTPKADALSPKSLIEILRAYEFPMFNMDYYKLYVHYRELEAGSIDIFERFKELCKSQKEELAALALIDELKEIDDCQLLNEANLVGVLRAFGVWNRRVVPVAYRIVAHYQKLGHDIESMIRNLVASLHSENTLPIFIALYEKLQNIDDCEMLTPSALKTVLSNYGHDFCLL